MNREIITIENGIVSVPASGKIWMTKYELAKCLNALQSKLAVTSVQFLKPEYLMRERFVELITIKMAVLWSNIIWK
ncbi:hypothetical protein FACS189431_6070 [Alphaproteobacteria bacterium]|nr:hypothetical protein FACS189431_6070 [Alphaproteobacteria bacterium]